LEWWENLESNLLVCHRNRQFLKNATLRMAIIGKSKGCDLIQNRSFYYRKGHSKTGKGCLKTGKVVRKQEKDVRKDVAYTLNFTYTEQNTKFTIGFGMVGKLKSQISLCATEIDSF
jgi:hypothetical protein